MYSEALWPRLDESPADLWEPHRWWSDCPGVPQDKPSTTVQHGKLPTTFICICSVVSPAYTYTCTFRPPSLRMTTLKWWMASCMSATLTNCSLAFPPRADGVQTATIWVRLDDVSITCHILMDGLLYRPRQPKGVLRGLWREVPPCSASPCAYV